MQFTGFAEEVETLSFINTRNILSNAKSMAVTISSYVQDTNKTWPNVTIPDFDARAAQILAKSNAAYVALLVHVGTSEKERQEWEMFSVQNQGWIQDGLDAMGVNMEALPISPVIHNLTGPAEYENYPHPYYSPVWQLSPPPEDPLVINYDFMTGAGYSSASTGLGSGRTNAVIEVLGESMILQPIYEDVQTPSNLEAESKIVGVVTVGVPWEFYFQRILPDDTAPILLVLKECELSIWTYEIHGREVLLLSNEADLHDPQYDFLGVYGTFEHDYGNETNNSEQGYSNECPID